jgi:hypothetical protein
MSIINLDSYIDSRVAFLYRIITEPMESWNAIGKYWLNRLDVKFNEALFVVAQIFLNRYALCYPKLI